jgi:hypothetical protein
MNNLVNILLENRYNIQNYSILLFESGYFSSYINDRTRNQILKEVIKLTEDISAGKKSLPYNLKRKRKLNEGKEKAAEIGLKLGVEGLEALKALLTGGEAAAKGAEAAGKGIETGVKAAETAGKTAEGAAKAVEAVSKGSETIFQAQAKAFNKLNDDIAKTALELSQKGLKGEELTKAVQDQIKKSPYY